MSVHVFVGLFCPSRLQGGIAAEGDGEGKQEEQGQWGGGDFFDEMPG